VTNSSITAPVTDILAKARSGANLSAKEAIILLETTDNRLIAQIRETADRNLYAGRIKPKSQD